mmetsp:Transcript_16185/g.33877  ORF Transcript_16185/g.33877 Transcript_16185/m.33877 type:complete len:806 (+) Transcript_16185:70-2487(+)
MQPIINEQIMSTLIIILVTLSSSPLISAFPIPAAPHHSRRRRLRNLQSSECNLPLKRNMLLQHMLSQSDSNALLLDNFSELTVVELKERLRGLNLQVSGRKSELIERLNEHYLGTANMAPILDGEPQGIVSEKIEDRELQLLSEEYLGDLTVAELKERLKGLGLPVGGRKTDLIERLKYRSADGSSNESETEEEMGSGNIENGSIIEASDSDLVTYENELFDNDIIIFDDSTTIKSPENAAQRRVRRKKYYKTQEVRELVRAKDPSAVQKAEEMIANLEYLAVKEGNEDYLPGPEQYTALIDAYANSGSSDAPERAEKIISRITEANEKSNRTVVTPTASMSDGIMKAYANLGTAEGAEQATAILNRMEYLREHNPLSNCKPSVYSYGVAISAWTRVGSQEAAENAEAILHRLFVAYDDMLNKGETGSYVQELKPNSVVFNSVIDAWARSGSPLAGEKAEALLQRMKELSMLPEYDIRPDTISFNTCIKAWCNSKSPNAAIKAGEVLSLLETHPKYAKRDTMVTVRPTKLSYNTVINAYAKSMEPDAAIHSQDILMRMIKSFKSDAFSTIKPDVVTFSSVLNSLAKSKTVPSKANKCLSILKSMTELHKVDRTLDTQPNIICYNTVLNACAFSAHRGDDEKREALSVAVETFNQLREGHYASPDAVSYGNMLKCCANLMPLGNSRTSMASKIFSSCVEDGLVGGMVLDEVRRSMPPDIFLKLLADCGFDKPMRKRKLPSSIELRDLPRKWTMNVKGSDMASRQRASFVKPKKERKTRRRRTERKPTVPVRTRQIVETAWISDKNV